MARMHSRKRGKARSMKRPKEVPSWAPYQAADVEKLIAKYAKQGQSSSLIGMTLRDKYGVASIKALTGKSVAAVLKEQKLGTELPEDLLSLIRRLVSIQAHLEKNHKDQTAKRGFQLTDSKIRRLMKYYKRTGKLAADWKLDRNRLKMYLE